MSVKPAAKHLGPNQSHGLRGHALGLLGANLAVGALALWALPLLIAVWRRPASGDTSPLQWLLAPWAEPGTGLTVVSLACDVLLLGVFLAGIALVVQAARMLGGREESREGGSGG